MTAAQLAAIKNNGCLLVSDNIEFEKIQITNDVFGMNYDSNFFKFGKAFFKIKNSTNNYFWFPHFVPHKDWKNTLSQNGLTLHVEYIGKVAMPKIPAACVNNTNNLYTFAKCADALGKISYRFVGVFVYRATANGVRIYNKVSDTGFI